MACEMAFARATPKGEKQNLLQQIICTKGELSVKINVCTVYS